MIVLDTSAAVEFLVGTDRVAEAARAIVLGETLAAPHAVDLECASTLRGLVQVGKLPPDEAERALRLLASMALRRFREYDAAYAPCETTYRRFRKTPRRGAGPVTAADVTNVLRQTDLLGSVPDDDLAALAGASRVRTFRRGQVVCVAGDPGDTLIVVLSGRVKVMVRSADGGELTLAAVGPGGTLGEVSIADGGPRSADVETLEDSQLLLLPRELIQDICARLPSAANALASSVAATLRRLTDATSDLVFLDLPRRLAKVLLSQPRDSFGVISPHLTQEQLAHQAAGTRQSVNAAMRGFERRGWIEVNGRAVTVREPEMLARFAGQ